MKRTVIAILIAVVVVVIGAGLCFAGMSAVGFKFRDLDRTEYVTNTYSFDSVRAIDIEGETADVELLAGEGGACKVVCSENEREKYTVTAQNGTLVIRPVDQKTRWTFFAFSFKNPKITVYLPAGGYDLLKAELDTGDIRVEKGLAFAAMDLDLDTGDIALDGVQADTITAHSDTGDILVFDMQPAQADLSVSTGHITLRNVICSGDLICKSNTGDISVEGVDGANLYFKASTGDITGSVLTEKIFYARSSTGKVSVPQTTAGGRCEAETSTGDIRLSLSGK